MKIVLHIGLEKNGSTSIQKFCAAGRDGLRRNRIVHPSGIGGPAQTNLMALARDIRSGDPVLREKRVLTDRARQALADRTARRIARALRGGDADTLALSCELLSSRLTTAEEIARLRAFLLRFSSDIRVVGYIRPQDDYLVSLFTTALYGRALAWRADAAPPTAMDLLEVERSRFEYDRIFAGWGDVFGDEALTIGVNRGDGFDTVAHFAALIGAPPPDKARSARRNASLSPAQARLMLHLNAQEWEAETYRAIVFAMMRIAAGPGIGLARQDRRRIAALVGESNERLRQRFLPETPAPLFPPPEKDDAAPPPTADEVASAAVELAAALMSERSAPGEASHGLARRAMRILTGR